MAHLSQVHDQGGGRVVSDHMTSCDQVEQIITNHVSSQLWWPTLNIP